MTTSTRLLAFRAENGAQLRPQDAAFLASNPPRQSRFTGLREALAKGEGGPSSAAPPSTASTSSNTPSPAAAPAKVDKHVVAQVEAFELRQRTETVMASPFAAARKASCQMMLGMGWSAERIVSHLPHLMTDAEFKASRDAQRHARLEAERNARADAVWGRAYGLAAPEMNDGRSAKQKASDDIWDRVWATKSSEGAPANALSPDADRSAPMSSDDVWSKVHGGKAL